MRLLAPLLALSLPALAQTPCLEWADEFGTPGVDGGITDAVVFDDGSGDALYIGGGFTWAAGVEVEDLMRWDGTSASTVADFGPDATAVITQVQVCDTGSGPELYVLGTFTTIDGMPFNHIARWDGTAWASVGGGIPMFGGGGNQSMTTTAVFDDGGGEALFVGVGAAFEIWRWDGLSWTVVGNASVGVDLPQAMAVYDDGTGAALYAGGFFNDLKKWDGSSWTVVGGGVTGTVEGLAVYDDGTGPQLYVGGNTSVYGALAFDFLASWDGTSWTAVPGGDLLRIESLGVHDLGGGPKLYAGRVGVRGDGIAAWDGSVWTMLGAGLQKAVTVQVSFDDGSGPELFVDVSLNTIGAIILFGIGVWDGAAWAELGASGNGLDGRVDTFESFDDGTGSALIAGGEFLVDGSQHLIPSVARWDGAGWSALGGGPGAPVLALAEFDDGTGPALYAAGGGDFTNLGGLAKWDGAAWFQETALFVNGRALEVFDDGSGEALYLGGKFTATLTVSVNNVARWDGTDFFALGVGVDAEVEALAPHDDGSGAALFVGGQFTSAGGAPASRVAKWDGAAWSALGSGVLGPVHALQSFGGALYAGGQFTVAGGVAADGIAMWNGSSWSALPTGALGTSSEVFALEVFDDGTGEALWMTGVFSTAGGLQAENLARWDGAQWSVPPGGLQLTTLLGGLNASLALHAHDDGVGVSESLFVGGSFSKAGAKQSTNIAALRRQCDCAPVAYCTAGTTTSGCQALLSATGTASASASSGFTLTASGVEGLKDGLFFFGVNGRQANTWGSGTSFQCVTPPVKRAGLLIGVGSVGLCDGMFNQDLNALWCPTCPRPSKNPGAGALVQVQLWFRDPFNTSNQTTSLSDAIEFSVCP